jgi:hypothetical protein
VISARRAAVGGAVSAAALGAADTVGATAAAGATGATRLTEAWAAADGATRLADVPEPATGPPSAHSAEQNVMIFAPRIRATGARVDSRGF